MKRVTGKTDMSVIGCIRLIVVVLLVAGFGVAQHDDGGDHDTHGAIAALQGHGAGSTGAPTRQHAVDHTCSPVSVCVPILLTPGTILRATRVGAQRVSRSHVHPIDLWRTRPASPIPIAPS